MAVPGLAEALAHPASTAVRSAEPTIKRPHSMNDFWEHCSALLERELTPQQYVTWIKPLAPVDFDAEASTLRIAAPNRFKLDWVKSQFSGRIADMAREYFSATIDVQFVLDPKATARSAIGQAPNAAPRPPHRKRLRSSRTRTLPRT